MLIELNGEMSVNTTVMESDEACDNADRLIRSRQSNKFSIENILGLKDDSKANRLELIDLCEKGLCAKFEFSYPIMKVDSA